MFKDGTGIIGFSQDDLFHGVCRVVFPDKTVYFGQFKNGKMKTEKGTIKFSNGDIYEGPMSNSKK